jgi:hypothetical protein
MLLPSLDCKPSATLNFPYVFGFANRVIWFICPQNSFCSSRSTVVAWRQKSVLCLPDYHTSFYAICSSFLALRHEGVWGSGCIDPYFLDLRISWRWVVSFTTWPLYSRGKNPRYSLDRRLGGPQSQSGRRGEEKILDPTGTRTPTFRSSGP